MAVFLNIPPRRVNENHREFTYRVIQKNIIDLTLPPNMILNEAELASALNVSRTPVHEALKLLAKESLIEIVPNKETRVAKIDFRQIMDGQFTRICLEPILVERLMGQVRNEDTKLLTNNLRLQYTALQANDKERYYLLDDDFHQLIYHLANKSRTFSLLQKFLNQYARFRRLHSKHGISENHAQESYSEHMQIFYAITIAKPLPESADMFFRRHVGSLIGSFPELIQQYPDYFCNYDADEFRTALETYLLFENAPR